MFILLAAVADCVKMEPMSFVFFSEAGNQPNTSKEVEFSLLRVTLIVRVSSRPGSWSSDGVGTLARYGRSLNLGASYIDTPLPTA